MGVRKLAATTAAATFLMLLQGGSVAHAVTSAEVSTMLRPTPRENTLITACFYHGFLRLDLRICRSFGHAERPRVLRVASCYASSTVP